MISLKTAKARSLKKWKAIRKDLPYIRHSHGQPDEKVYGECGFCSKFRTEEIDDCPNCPLSPKICFCVRIEALYWQICAALGGGKEVAPLIDQMIKAIEDVEV